MERLTLAAVLVKSCPALLSYLYVPDLPSLGVGYNALFADGLQYCRAAVILHAHLVSGVTQAEVAIK
jgi:hypothetical protein